MAIRSVMLACLALVLALPSAASARQHERFALRVEASSTLVFETKPYPADAEVSVSAKVKHRPWLDYEIHDDRSMALCLRGDGISVTFLAKPKRAPVRVEVANYRKKAVSVIIKLAL